MTALLSWRCIRPLRLGTSAIVTCNVDGYLECFAFLARALMSNSANVPDHHAFGVLCLTGYWYVSMDWRKKTWIIPMSNKARNHAMLFNCN
eukprot:574834-Amphidinium_carterae.1